MKNRNHLIYLAIILALGAFSIGILTKNSSTKVAYINLSEVFEKFELKKELSIKFDKGSIGRDELLNEMYLGLEKMAKEIQNNPTDEIIKEYRKKEAIYNEKKEQFDSQKMAQLKEYDAQIFKQLTQYVKDYGQKEGVDVILGANGQGNLMYCADDMNITEDVITYINLKYKGESND